MSRAPLSGWGNYPAADCRQVYVRSPQEARKAIVSEPHMIAYGAGRSYGDAALNRDCTLMMCPLNRMLAFDAQTGLLRCESGVMLADVLSIFVPRGWFPSVTPGTKYVTVGGMVAADVHGKNHHSAGSFCDYVEQIELMLADGSQVTCSSTQNSELFAATRGGMGLTGIILSVTFRLMRVETAYIRQQTKRAGNLDEIVAYFDASAHWSYCAAWIDCLAQGQAAGRSVLYLGEHATAEECAAMPAAVRLLPRRKKTVTVPPVFPSFAVNRFSVRAFNALYYARGGEKSDIVDYDTFFYPLDALLLWNRLYGRRGFVQYQCVLPRSQDAVRGLRRMLAKIAEAGAGSFLAVLKLLGPQNSGMMSFPMEGYTLALDFPVSAPSFTLLDALDIIVAEHGGRLYLAKDARAKPEAIRHGYPALARFQELRKTRHADMKFSSLLSERLAL